MKIRVGKFTDGSTEWFSLIIDNISVAGMAVRQIIGEKISSHALNDHAIYYSKAPEFVTVDTAKGVFKDICTSLYKDEHLVMNMNGGYIPLKSIDWKLLETKHFEFEYGANLNTLLRTLNEKEKEFKELTV